MNRKKWSNEEKITIVLNILRGDDSVAAICARNGVSATQAYRWQKQFLSGGRAAREAIAVRDIATVDTAAVAMMGAADKS